MCMPYVPSVVCSGCVLCYILCCYYCVSSLPLLCVSVVRYVMYLSFSFRLLRTYTMMLISPNNRDNMYTDVRCTLRLTCIPACRLLTCSCWGVCKLCAVLLRRTADAAVVYLCRTLCALPVVVVMAAGHNMLIFRQTLCMHESRQTNILPHPNNAQAVTVMASDGQHVKT